MRHLGHCPAPSALIRLPLRSRRRRRHQAAAPPSRSRIRCPTTMGTPVRRNPRVSALLPVHAMPPSTARVEKPRNDAPISQNKIRITTQGRMRNYIIYGMSLLEEEQMKKKRKVRGPTKMKRMWKEYDPNSKIQLKSIDMVKCKTA